MMAHMPLLTRGLAQRKDNVNNTCLIQVMEAHQVSLLYHYSYLLSPYTLLFSYLISLFLSYVSLIRLWETSGRWRGLRIGLKGEASSERRAEIKDRSFCFCWLRLLFFFFFWIFKDGSKTWSYGRDGQAGVLI